AVGANGNSPTVSMPNNNGPLNGNSFGLPATSTANQTDGNGNLVSTTWTYTDSNGSAQQFRVDYGTVSMQLHLCQLLDTDSCPCTEDAQSLQLPQKLTLPTGKFYLFTWSTDGNADLLRIDLPTGGYISYAYQTSTKHVGRTYTGGDDRHRGSGSPTEHYI